MEETEKLNTRERKKKREAKRERKREKEGNTSIREEEKTRRGQGGEEGKESG